MIDLNGFGPQLVAGTLLTIQLAICSMLFGLVIGLVSAAGKLSHRPLVRSFFSVYTAIVRGLPELLLILGVYYGGTILLSKLFHHYHEFSSFIAGVIALGLIFGSYATEIFRGAYLAVHKGQLEAAKAYGFSTWSAFYHIMLPQVWRHALPGLGNIWLVLLKDTGIVSLLGLSELLNHAQLAAVYTHEPFKFYLIAALIYLLLTSVSLFILKHFNTKIKREYRNFII